MEFVAGAIAIQPLFFDLAEPPPYSIIQLTCFPNHFFFLQFNPSTTTSMPLDAQISHGTLTFYASEQSWKSDYSMNVAASACSSRWFLQGFSFIVLNKCLMIPLSVCYLDSCYLQLRDRGPSKPLNGSRVTMAWTTTWSFDLLLLINLSIKSFSPLSDVSACQDVRIRRDRCQRDHEPSWLNQWCYYVCCIIYSCST